MHTATLMLIIPCAGEGALHLLNLDLEQLRKDAIMLPETSLPDAIRVIDRW